MTSVSREPAQAATPAPLSRLARARRARARLRSVITFTTVGLGDYVKEVPTDHSLWEDSFSMSLWYVFFGLLIVAAIVNDARDHFQFSFLFAIFVISPAVLRDYYKEILGLCGVYGPPTEQNASGKSSAQVAPGEDEKNASMITVEPCSPSPVSEAGMGVGPG